MADLTADAAGAAAGEWADSLRRSGGRLTALTRSAWNAARRPWVIGLVLVVAAGTGLALAAAADAAQQERYAAAVAKAEATERALQEQATANAQGQRDAEALRQTIDGQLVELGSSDGFAR